MQWQHKCIPIHQPKNTKIIKHKATKKKLIPKIRKKNCLEWFRQWRFKEHSTAHINVQTIEKRPAKQPSQNRIRFIFNLVAHVFILLLFSNFDGWFFFIHWFYIHFSGCFASFDLALYLWKSCCDNWAKYKRFSHRRCPLFLRYGCSFFSFHFDSVIALGSIEL